MALPRAEDLEGGLKEPEKHLDLPLSSPNNPVIRLRALRVWDLSRSYCCLRLFVLSRIKLQMRSSISLLYPLMGSDPWHLEVAPTVTLEVHDVCVRPFVHRDVCSNKACNSSICICICTHMHTKIHTRITCPADSHFFMQLHEWSWVNLENMLTG